MGEEDNKTRSHQVFSGSLAPAEKGDSTRAGCRARGMTGASERESEKKRGQEMGNASITREFLHRSHSKRGTD